MKFKGSYIRIPIILLNDSNCSDSSKLVLGLIGSLSMQKGYCYANNKYFAEVLGKKKDTISKIISNLKKGHYIYTKQEDNHRKIYINPNLLEDDTLGIVENSDSCMVEKSYYNTEKEKRKINKKRNIIIEPIIGIDKDGNETCNNKPLKNEPMTEDDCDEFDKLVNNVIESIDNIKVREE